MVTPEQIEAWSRAIGLPRCIGEAFVAERGRLPGSIPELEQWGNSTGRRDPRTGVWRCEPSSPLVPPQPPPQSLPGGGGRDERPGLDLLTWVKENPIPAAIILILLLRR